VRHQLGISEQEAAAAFGVTVRTYRRYEAGKPALEGYGDFADAFGVSLNWLVGCKVARAEVRGFGCVLFVSTRRGGFGSAV
jgi:transcriptional regulator with XRE-family HTH domain